MKENKREEAGFGNLQTTVEEKLAGLPIVEYAWLDCRELPFSERVREICRMECPRYGTSWSCPPGVGTVEECRKRCGAYSGAFVFTTIAEVKDIANMEETLATRGGHEAVTAALMELFHPHTRALLALSGESCGICGTCAYPEAPCRYPEKMIPCVEGYGIVVPLLAEQTGLTFDHGGNVVTWFGLLLYSEAEA